MENETIPRLVWERDQARSSHTVKVLSRCLVFLTLAFLAVVAAFLLYIHQKDKEWLDFLSQYDFEGYSYSQDGEGVNIMGDNNGVNYGAESYSTENEAQGQES